MLGATLLLIKIGNEYVILDGLDFVVIGLRPVTAAFEEFIPQLAKNGDFLAGKSGISASSWRSCRRGRRR